MPDEPRHVCRDCLHLDAGDRAQLKFAIQETLKADERRIQEARGSSTADIRTTDRSLQRILGQIEGMGTSWASAEGPTDQPRAKRWGAAGPVPQFKPSRHDKDSATTSAGTYFTCWYPEYGIGCEARHGSVADAEEHMRESGLPCPRDPGAQAVPSADLRNWPHVTEINTRTGTAFPEAVAYNPCSGREFERSVYG